MIPIRGSYKGSLQIDTALEKETAAQRKVADVDKVPDSQLFFVDTVSQNLNNLSPLNSFLMMMALDAQPSPQAGQDEKLHS